MRIGCFVIDLKIANIIFAFMATTSMVGTNVMLPLWIDSTTKQTSNDGNHNGNLSNRNASSYNDKNTPRVDSYFVLSFTSLSTVVIYAIALLFIWLFQPLQLGETEKNFSKRQLFLVGFFNALNGVFLVFSSSGNRTAPFLQALLGNFMIPLVITLRWVNYCSTCLPAY